MEDSHCMFFSNCYNSVNFGVAISMVTKAS